MSPSFLSLFKFTNENKNHPGIEYKKLSSGGRQTTAGIKRNDDHHSCDALVEKTNQTKHRTNTEETEFTILSPNSQDESLICSKSSEEESSNREDSSNRNQLEILGSSDDEDYLIWHAETLSEDSDERSNQFRFPEDSNEIPFFRTSPEKCRSHNHLSSDAATLRKRFFLYGVPESIAEEASVGSV